jgi:sugar-specific transcriptional regulator TrmB
VFKESISMRSSNPNLSEFNNAEENSQHSFLQEASTFDKAAHHIAMRFKDDSKKFSGALGECWSEFLSEYLYAAEDYKLNPSQKLQYLHHLLKENAKRFFTRNIQGTINTFSEASAMMEQEYNSISRRNRISNHLKSLRISQFITSDCNTSDALEKLHGEISKLAPQGPLIALPQ